jgi:tRNA G18 (ribose-2'-O)-methylase SpoU
MTADGARFVAVDDPGDERLAIFRRNERGLANRPSKRSGTGLFMAEGDLVVERALALGCRPVAALVDAARPPAVALALARDVEVFAGGAEVRAMVTQLGVPLSVVAVFERPPRPSLADLARTTHRLVLLEAVDNPVNVGSIARNAAALGWGGLVVDLASADPLARRSLRASMGQALALPHARCERAGDAARMLARDGFTVVALTPADIAPPLDDLAVDRAAPVVLLLGAERDGLSPEALGAATLTARIPMAAGVDSLNVAAASAIGCYVLRRPT